MKPPPLTSFYVLPRERALLLMATWTACEHLHYDIAAAFYDRLFEQLPKARSVLGAGMPGYEARLVSMISLTMAHFDQPDHVRATLIDAGISYARAGFEEAHYRIAAAALRASLGAVLRASYTLEHDAACESLAAEVICTMLEGARVERETSRARPT
jgi:hemoglobin-like flavoprotein